MNLSLWKAVACVLVFSALTGCESVPDTRIEDPSEVMSEGGKNMTAERDAAPEEQGKVANDHVAHSWAPPSRSEGGFVQIGLASWYGKPFHGRQTANGERFNMYALSAAHRTLPLGTHVKVTHLSSGRSVIVRINDRGPYVRGRVIDLSMAAAKVLDLPPMGTARVMIKSVTLGRAEQGAG
ncbi:septal ring lytic transglycosylase RlpA family protein [Burkholderia ubonensis]|uniref:septal ring lytic transglycosylase RlpA family protein n=1 Tax=Burkholderia ubonensis TaxID=101571 RepID=UPI000A5CFFAB|nr:septal ring lytic transglycosylase RlpA family protein [Burkholderia ubonensis]